MDTYKIIAGNPFVTVVAVIAAKNIVNALNAFTREWEYRYADLEIGRITIDPLLKLTSELEGICVFEAIDLE